MTDEQLQCRAEELLVYAQVQCVHGIWHERQNAATGQVKQHVTFRAVLAPRNIGPHLLAPSRLWTSVCPWRVTRVGRTECARVPAVPPGQPKDLGHVFQITFDAPENPEESTGKGGAGFLRFGASGRIRLLLVVAAGPQTQEQPIERPFQQQEELGLQTLSGQLDTQLGVEQVDEKHCVNCLPLGEHAGPTVDV